MAATIDQTFGGSQDERILAGAAEHGFRLSHYETEHGQLVWEWRRGTEPRPQFLSRRVALHWMRDWLGKRAIHEPANDQ